MNQRTRAILRYLFVVLLGIFLHFAYELSGENPIVGLFALVRESVWEHLKLLFFPMLVLTIWDLFTTQKNNLCFLPARSSGILSGMAFIVSAFYIITGILGSNIAWINILIYFLGVAVAFWIEKKKYCNRNCNFIHIRIAIITFILLIILFIIFTITPPALGIFIPFA